MNNGRVHNGTGRDADVAAVQIMVHRVQYGPAQIVFFQQVTELQNGRLVRRRSPPQIHARRAPQHPRVVQRLFGRRIAQVGPLLQSESAA